MSLYVQKDTGYVECPGGARSRLFLGVLFLTRSVRTPSDLVLLEINNGVGVDDEESATHIFGHPSDALDASFRHKLVLVSTSLSWLILFC